MEKDKAIWSELGGLSATVAGIKNHNVFSVPNGYFDNLAENIMLLVKQTGQPSFNTLQNMPFTVPHGYFEGLADRILKVVTSENTQGNDVWNELQELSPLLNTISKAPVFSVPQGYFNDLEITPPKKKEAKVVPFRAGKFIKYAVAAVITGFIAITGVLFLREPDTATTTGNIALQEELGKLPDEEIIENLNTFSSAADFMQTDSSEAGAGYEPVDLVGEVSIEEMIEFLEENEEPGETPS